MLDSDLLWASNLKSIGDKWSGPSPLYITQVPYIISNVGSSLQQKKKGIDLYIEKGRRRRELGVRR